MTKSFVSTLFLISIALSVLPSPAFAERTAADLMQKQGRTDAIRESQSDDEQGNALIFKNTLEFDNTLPSTQILSNRQACQAFLSLDYFEEDDQVRIETRLENQTCGASSGLYQVEIKTIGPDGEIERKVYSEEWSRVDDKVVTAEHVYPLPAETELLRAQSKLRQQDGCWCDQGPAQTVPLPSTTP